MAVVKINAIELPKERAPELERRFAARKDAMDGVPGFLGFQLLRPVAGETRYFVVTEWESDEAFQSWRNSDSATDTHAGERRRPVSTDASTLEFEVVDLEAVAARDTSES